MIKTLPTLENLSRVTDFIEKNINIPVENILIEINVSPEEHLVFDKKLHDEWGEGEFQYNEIIDLKIGNINFKIKANPNVETDTLLKVDEHGRTYI